MKAVITHYSVNGEDFISINNRKREYTLKYLERLAGFRLTEHAPKILQRFGFIRVTKTCSGSYYAGEL